MPFRLLLEDGPLSLDTPVPLLPLRDIVVFPGSILPLFVARPTSLAAVEAAETGDRLLVCVTQRRPEVSEPGREDLFEIGVVSRLRQVLRLPDGSMRILVEGLVRARIRSVSRADGIQRVEVGPGPREGRVGSGAHELLRDVQSLFLEFVRFERRIPEDAVREIVTGRDPVDLSFRIASHLRVHVTVRQGVLETPGAVKRLQVLAGLLASETEVARAQSRLDGPAERMLRDANREASRTAAAAKAGARSRRERRDAREGSDDADLQALDRSIREARMPAAAREKATRELARLSRMAPLSPEATVSRTYIEWLLAVPWVRRTKDRTEIAEAAALLDRDHYGLQAVKERIVEQIAVMRLNASLRGPVLCLVGPPGVGKTSLGESIARSLGRKFVRMSLGGVRDEAEIRGHRRTYIGAMPGRIVQAMRRAGSVNPVILLDEIDKLGADYRGDPSSALLEVLDPEQNRAFNDHYLELDYDLSRVLFLTTANGIAGIPGPLRDRMETLRLPGYLVSEKLAIAERFLLPKQRTACGLAADDLSIAPEALERIVSEFTREAGVRGLERDMAALCRKVARRKAAGELEKAVRIEVGQVETWLGPSRFPQSRIDSGDRVGLSTGLAWSEAGGSILQVEASALPGRGKLILTGRLGRVLRESARAAFSCIRARAARLGLEPDFHRRVDLHIHLPEGEVPKDGPSAGTAIALAMISALTAVPTRRGVAMTGELTLRGKVLPIGGLVEKAAAARRAGVRILLVPAANRAAVEEIPAEVRERLRFVPVETLEDIVRWGLTRRPSVRPKVLPMRRRPSVETTEPRSAA